MSKRKPAAARPDTPLWSAPVAIAEIPEIGKHVELAADAAARAAVAATVGLVELTRLEASFDLTRHGRDGIHVMGRVAADIVQSCIVTLEPLPSRIEEDVDLVFMPPVAAAPEPPAAASSEVEPPEVLSGETIDLGALSTEFLILGIDPYARKEGASFESPPAVDDPAAHPFAALAALKKEPGA